MDSTRILSPVLTAAMDKDRMLRNRGVAAHNCRPTGEIFEHVLSVGELKTIDLSASLGFVPVPGLGFTI